jgi:uncharacterized cupin superfamily protein/RimJ/RimL family protein N-acetyltransferase
MSIYGPQSFTTKKGKTLVLRHCTPQDAPVYPEFQQKIAKETHNTMQVPGNLPDLEKVRKNWAQCIEEPMFLRVGAFDGTRLVGMISVYPPRFGEHPWVKHVVGFGMMIIEEFWGQGLGKKLMQVMDEFCLSKGVSRIEAEVRTENSRGLQLYLRMGFKVEGLARKASFFNGRYHDVYNIAKLFEDRASPDPDRPAFIKNYVELQEGDDSHYKGSDELLSIGSPFSSAFGMTKIGVHHERLLPGRRTSWPHAESSEEEFAFVIEGYPDVWIDGHLYPLRPGDAVGFPAGTGIAHTFINNTDFDARILVVGERNKPENKIVYPLHPARNAEIGERHWSDAPKQPLGPHDGLPDILRKKQTEKS